MIERSMKLKWNFGNVGVGGLKPTKPLVVGVWMDILRNITIGVMN